MGLIAFLRAAFRSSAGIFDSPVFLAGGIGPALLAPLVLFVPPALLAPVALLTPVAMGAEREFATVVAVGSGVPVDSGEGLISPVLFLDHESGAHYGAGTLRVLLKTAVLEMGMTHPLADWIHLEYRARLVAWVEGAPFSIYSRGERKIESTFVGNSAAAILAGKFFPGAKWGFGLEYERRAHDFEPNDNTAPGFVLPQNFIMRELRASLIRRRLWGIEDARMKLTGSFGRRERWRDWGLDPAADGKAGYARQRAQLKLPIAWSDFSATDIRFEAGAGSHLDLFSGYWIGGLYGIHPVGGYFRQEFRAEKMAVLNIRHDFRFAEDRILSLYGDAAWLEEIDLPIFAGGPSSRWIGSLGLGYRYGVRAWKGLPVMVRYAEGLNVPDGSLEPRRREISLLAAVGF